MRIAVCLKQVPAVNKVQINAATNTIIRNNVAATLNPFDDNALEEALRIKEKYGAEVTVITMGPPAASEVLTYALFKGADEALLLSDKAFAGADTLATSYTLFTAIRLCGGFDLIICGKQAIDGDTAQVGPELAEHLELPHITNVNKITAINNSSLTVTRLTDDGYEKIELALPALISVVKEINTPRFPSLSGVLSVKQDRIKLIRAHDLKVDAALLGLDGSPTKVLKTFVPEYKINTQILQGKPEKQAAAFCDFLQKSGII